MFPFQIFSRFLLIELTEDFSIASFVPSISVLLLGPRRISETNGPRDVKKRERIPASLRDYGR